MVTWNYVCEPCRRDDHDGCVPGSGAKVCDCAVGRHGRARPKQAKPKHKPKHKRDPKGKLRCRW